MYAGIAMRDPTGDTPTLLVVSVVGIWPVTSGFQLRAAEVVRRLTSRWDLVLATPGADQLPDAFAGVRARVPLPVTSPWPHLPANHDPAGLSGPLCELVERWRPAAVLFLCGSEYLADALPPDVPTVSDHVDCLAIAALESWHDAKGVRARARVLQDAWRMARFERTLVRRMDRTIVAGERDAKLLRRMGGGAPHMLPNGVETSAEVCWDARTEWPSVSFSGVLDYPPNADAARFLVREVWPTVRHAHSTAELRLIGRRPGHEVRALTREPGVSLHANVPDMAQSLRATWLAVAPMRRGSGVKNKVLEAWAAGRAVVMTPRAVNGLALPPGHEGLVAEGATALADAIVSLLHAPGRLGTLGADALAFTRTHYSWSGMADRIHELLLEAVQTKGGGGH